MSPISWRQLRVTDAPLSSKVPMSRRTGCGWFLSGAGPRRGAAPARKVRNAAGLPVTTDMHTVEKQRRRRCCRPLAVPAFLPPNCLVVACFRWQPVNIRKGNSSLQRMAHIADKAVKAGNDRVMLTEREAHTGTAIDCRLSFSADHARDRLSRMFRCLTLCANTGSAGGASGGKRGFCCRSCVPRGWQSASCVFCEVHPDPANAKSDRDTQWPLNGLVEAFDAADQPSGHTSPASSCLDTPVNRLAAFGKN